MSNFEGGGINMALTVMGFGYWLMFLCAFILITQVFFSRQATMGSGQMAPPPPLGAQVAPTPPPAMPSQRQSAPPPAAAPVPQQQRAFANAWLINTATQDSYQLFQGDTRIGRSKQRNDVVLSSPSVSREHLIIRQEGQHFIAYGTGSRVPPYLNGQQLQGKQVLNTNDEITLGDQQLRFVRS